MSLSLQSEPQPGFWASVRDALRGSHQDFTSGDLNRSILLLAIPMVLEMCLESLFAVVDTFWVGRLGANAVATVGLTEVMLALAFAIGLGLSLSTTAMVARRTIHGRWWQSLRPRWTVCRICISRVRRWGIRRSRC